MYTILDMRTVSSSRQLKSLEAVGELFREPNGKKIAKDAVLNMRNAVRTKFETTSGNRVIEVICGTREMILAYENYDATESSLVGIVSKSWACGPIDFERVFKIAVADDHRHSGVGRELLRHVAMRCHYDNESGFYLLASVNAQPFYTKVGLEPCWPKDVENYGRKSILMGMTGQQTKKFALGLYDSTLFEHQ